MLGCWVLGCLCGLDSSRPGSFSGPPAHLVVQQEALTPLAPVVPRDLTRGITLDLRPTRGDHDTSDSKLDGEVDTSGPALFGAVLSAIAASGNNIAPGCFLWECISPLASDGVPQLSASYVPRIWSCVLGAFHAVLLCGFFPGLLGLGSCVTTEASML